MLLYLAEKTNIQLFVALCSSILVVATSVKRWCVFFVCTGDVHVGMVDRGGQLEVEVNQARGLIPKPGSKNIPGTLN